MELSVDIFLTFSHIFIRIPFIPNVVCFCMNRYEHAAAIISYLYERIGSVSILL